MIIHCTHTTNDFDLANMPLHNLVGIISLNIMNLEFTKFMIQITIQIHEDFINLNTKKSNVHIHHFF